MPWDTPFLGGSNTAIEQLRSSIDRVAASSANVLVLGEPWTGHESVARVIHSWGPRRHGPIEVVLYPAIPSHRLDAVIFGNHSGARDDFAGGHVHSARGGTLVLHEIDWDTPPPANLLKRLARGEFEEVVGHEARPTDVRLICTATVDPGEESAAAARFEAHLPGVSSIVLRLPPLRERREDIPAIVAQIIANAAVAHELAVERCSPRVLERLSRHSWWGNWRQLSAAVERGVMFAASESRMIIEERDLPAGIGAD